MNIIVVVCLLLFLSSLRKATAGFRICHNPTKIVCYVSSCTASFDLGA
jgi:hypothetical protein